MSDETKIVTITVKLTIRADADPQEVVDEMGYNFEHDDIVDAEIMELEDPNEDNTPAL